MPVSEWISPANTRLFLLMIVMVLACYDGDGISFHKRFRYHDLFVLVVVSMASTQFLELTRQLLYPPTHPNHVVSLYTSLLAVRRCLNLEAGANQQGFEGALSIEATCQAWTLLAEIGMMIIGAGLGGPSGPDWARGISADVERAISEGLKLSLTSKVCLGEGRILCIGTDGK